MGYGLHITDSPHHSSKLCEGHLRKSYDTQYIDLAIQYSSEGDWLEYSDIVWLKITDTVNICGLTFADVCLVINFNIYFGIFSLIDFLAWFIGFDNACIRSTCGMEHHISQIRSRFIHFVSDKNNPSRKSLCLYVSSCSMRGSNRLLFVSKSCCECVYENRNLYVSAHRFDMMFRI